MRSSVAASLGGAISALLAASQIGNTRAAPIGATNETAAPGQTSGTDIFGPVTKLVYVRHWSVPATTDTETVVETDVATSRTTVVEVIPVTLTPSGTTITSTSHITLVSDVTLTETSYSPVIVGEGTPTDQPSVIISQTQNGQPWETDTGGVYCPSKTERTTSLYPGVWTDYLPSYNPMSAYWTGSAELVTNVYSTTVGCTATLNAVITPVVTAVMKGPTGGAGRIAGCKDAKYLAGIAAVGVGGALAL